MTVTFQAHLDPESYAEVTHTPLRSEFTPQELKEMESKFREFHRWLEKFSFVRCDMYVGQERYERKYDFPPCNWPECRD